MIKRIKKKIKMKIKQKGIESQGKGIANFSRTTKRFYLSEEIESYEGYNDETGTPIIWHQVKTKNGPIIKASDTNLEVGMKLKRNE